MKRRILVVVATEADKTDLVELMKSLVPAESIERATTGKFCDLILKNGDAYKVWSVEQFGNYLSCGASFDAVMYLAHPVPKYIEKEVQVCMLKEPL